MINFAKGRKIASDAADTHAEFFARMMRARRDTSSNSVTISLPLPLQWHKRLIRVAKTIRKRGAKGSKVSLWASGYPLSVHHAHARVRDTSWISSHLMPTIINLTRRLIDEFDNIGTDAT